MASTSFLAVVLPLALAAPGPDEKKTALPTTPPPRIACVSALKPEEDEITLHEVTVQMVPELRKELRTVNGKTVEVAATYYKAVVVQQQRKCYLKEGKAYDTAGATLEAAEVWKRLKVGSPVLVSGDGNKVDPAYLGVVAKEAVILTFPDGLDTPVTLPAKIPPPAKP
jgi:hypothetical protein